MWTCVINMTLKSKLKYHTNREQQINVLDITNLSLLLKIFKKTQTQFDSQQETVNLYRIL